MKTLAIENGDISVADGTGIVNVVEKIAKASQDVARHLLEEFDSFFNEGNELVSLTVDDTSFGISEALVVQYIYAAMNRLIAKQRFSSDDGRILKINQVRTRVVGLSTVVFMVEILYSDGTVASIVDQIRPRPTQLNQVLNPNAVIGV